jgi:hypothetical protein
MAGEFFPPRVSHSPTFTPVSVGFSGLSLPSWMTYTGGNGAYNTSTPLVAIAASNAPRFDNVPPAIFTNQLVSGNDFTNSHWQSLSNGAGSSNPVLTPSYAAGPDGIAGSASRIRFTKGPGITSADYSLFRSSTYLTGNICGQIWVKSTDGTPQQIWGYFNYSGTVTAVQITVSGLGWSHFTIPSITSPGAGVYLTIGLFDTHDGINGGETADVLIAFADMELGTVPTPNPAGALLGLLIEPTGTTNQLLDPNSFATANWAVVSAGTGSNPTVTGSYAVGPDGVTGSATRVQFAKGAGTTSGDYSLLRSGVLLGAGDACVGQIWVKSTSGSAQTIAGYLNNGLTAVPVIITAGADWTNIPIPSVISQSGVTTYFSIGAFATNGAAAADVLIAFADMEYGAVASSYTPGIRAADVLSFAAPQNSWSLLFTFDDGSTQTIAVYPFQPFTVPTLNRKWITSIQAFQAQQFNLYCDSVNGNDANNGLTAATAVKTVAQLLTLLGSSTNVGIGLACGSVWKEQLTIGAQNGIHIGAYGSGAQPLVDGSDVILTSAWSLAAGYANVYQASLPITGIMTSGSDFVNVYENGLNLVQVASEAACQALPGSYYVPNMDTSPITLYIQPYGSGNPATDGNLYEYTNRGSCINLSGNSCSVWYIATRRNRGNDGGLNVYGLNGYFYQCSASDGGKHAAYMAAGGVADTCVFTNAYYGITANPLGILRSVSFWRTWLDGER